MGETFKKEENEVFQEEFLEKGWKLKNNIQKKS